MKFSQDINTDILKLYNKGLADKEIANRTGYSQHTIRIYRLKLGLKRDAKGRRPRNSGLGKYKGRKAKSHPILRKYWRDLKRRKVAKEIRKQGGEG